MNSTFDTETIAAELVADIISVSKATLINWEKSGKLVAVVNPITKQIGNAVPVDLAHAVGRSMIS
jgi:site-specific DNA-cytosine methylase